MYFSGATNYSARPPQISGNKVVWSAYVGFNNWEIFLYDGATTFQVSNNPYDDKNPKISGNNIVWQGYDGNDWEIYMYEIKEFPWVLFLPKVTN